MKLIDLDELREYCWEYPGDIESITMELRNIPTLLSTFPTIEAIPIEWLLKWNKAQATRGLCNVKEMIKDWRKENESNTNT